MYIYYNSSFQRNQEPPRNFPGEYSTDLISHKSVNFLQDAAVAKKPFFLTVTPIGPHTETVFPTQPGMAPAFNPPVPADRHKDLFQDTRIPRTENFNPSQVSIAHVPYLCTDKSR
jgi:N-acetylglucosamine-6-sulfatase